MLSLWRTGGFRSIRTIGSRCKHDDKSGEYIPTYKTTPLDELKASEKNTLQHPYMHMSEEDLYKFGNPDKDYRRLTLAQKSSFRKKYFEFVLMRSDKFKNLVKDWLDTRDRLSQLSVESRITALGADISAAYFVISRGGAVKFYGNDKWYTYDRKGVELPNEYESGWDIEKIDCEKMFSKLRYEGISNFENLRGPTWLSVKGCTLVDDWCLDALTAVLRKLEYIDISNTSVTHRGISALCKLNNPKLLILNSKQVTEQMEIACSLLESEYPKLLIQID